jgi:hypothetical protein
MSTSAQSRTPTLPMIVLGFSGFFAWLVAAHLFLTPREPWWWRVSAAALAAFGSELLRLMVRREPGHARGAGAGDR